MSNTRKLPAKIPPAGVSNVDIKPLSTNAATGSRTTTTTTKQNANKLSTTTKTQSKLINTNKVPSTTSSTTKTVKSSTSGVPKPSVERSKPVVGKTVINPSNSNSITSNTKNNSIQNVRTVRASAVTATAAAKKLLAVPMGSPARTARKAATQPARQSVSKANAVLDTYHSVTVTTPPSQRKLLSNTTLTKPGPAGGKQLERKASRTLEPDEILALKRDGNRFDVARQDSHAQRRDNQTMHAIAGKTKVPVNEPIAFEITFESKKDQLELQQEMTSRKLSEGDQVEYSDDCESSFSSRDDSAPTDFDSDRRSSTSTETEKSYEEEDDDDNDEEQSSNFIQSDDIDADNLNDLQTMTHYSDVTAEDDESQSTQYPLTVIHRSEHKLDSGNYDLNSMRKGHRSQYLSNQLQQQDDSLDTISAPRSDYFDSGLGSGGSNSALRSERSTALSNTFAYSYGGYVDFNRRPALHERGIHLMTKLRFDTVAFTLFELTPSSYETYMQIYGNLNTVQAQTQTTQDNCVERDMQTEEIMEREIWTQHPPFYDKNLMQRLSCGPGDTYNAINADNNLFNLFLSTQMPIGNRKRKVIRKRKMIDYERLNGFLLKASLLVSRVLASNNNTHNQRQPWMNDQPKLRLISSSSGHSKQSDPKKLNTQLLNALRVVRIFANHRHHLILTVHESPPDAAVYRYDFTQLLMLWSHNDHSNLPLRLMSTWSEVTGAVICGDATDVIVCSLRDGSIALWNLRETYSYCSKLDGCLTHFAATHSIVPHWCGGGNNTMSRNSSPDFGTAVDIRNFRESDSRSLGLGKPYQFISLHDSGLLTIWSLIKGAGGQDFQNPTQRQQQSSQPSNKSKLSDSKRHQSYKSSDEHNTIAASSGMHLVQSAICDLRAYMEDCTNTQTLKSDFEKTRLLFQKNIYADELLRELNELKAVDSVANANNLQGLRFTSLDVGANRIYVCTNRNFLLCCTRSLKWERIRKMVVNESRFLSLTTLRVLIHEDYVAVGLTNGSVVVVSCGQNDAHHDDRPNENRNMLHTATAKPSELDIEALTRLGEFDIEASKSCAIQNIILNVKRSFDAQDERDYMQHPVHNHRVTSATSAIRPMTSNTAAAAVNWQRYFAKNICDQQLLLSGSDLRENLVQSLEVSMDGWRLFVLANGKMRVYDFAVNREIEIDFGEFSGASKKIVDFAISKADIVEQQNVLVLNGQNEVELHCLE